MKERSSYLDALKEVLLLGGDVDTNAAIMGILLGARDGLDSLPKDCYEKVIR